MSDRAKYSRVYWRVLEDTEFDGIRSSVAHFGAWTLMLLAADMSWPTPAYVPPIVPRRSVDALCANGLIELLDGGRFRLRGIDKEREARKSAATRDPVGTHLGAKRDPDGRVDKTSKAETRQDEHTDKAGARVDEDPASTYWALTGRFPTEKTLAWIDDLVSRFGMAAVDRALAGAHIEDRSTQTLLGRAQDKLRAEARELDRKERAEEQERLREKRSKPPTVEPWREELRRRIEEQYGGAA